MGILYVYLSVGHAHADVVLKGINCHQTISTVLYCLGTLNFFAPKILVEVMHFIFNTQIDCDGQCVPAYAQLISVIVHMTSFYFREPVLITWK